MGNYLLLAAFSVASFMAGVYVGARLAGRGIATRALRLANGDKHTAAEAMRRVGMG